MSWIIYLLFVRKITTASQDLEKFSYHGNHYRSNQVGSLIPLMKNLLYYKPQVILTTFNNLYVLSPAVKYVLVTGENIDKSSTTKGLGLVFYDDSFKRVAVYVKQELNASIEIKIASVVYAQVNNDMKFGFVDKWIMITNNTKVELTLNFPYNYDVVAKSGQHEMMVTKYTSSNSYVFSGSELNRYANVNTIHFETKVRKKEDFIGIKSFNILFGTHDIYINKLNEIMMISNKALSQDAHEYLNFIKVEVCLHYEVQFIINTINSNTFYIKFLRATTFQIIPCLVKITFDKSEFFLNAPFDYQSFFVESPINNETSVVPLIGSICLNAEKDQENNLKIFIDTTIKKKSQNTLVHAVTQSEYPVISFPTDLSLAGCSIFIELENIKNIGVFQGMPKKTFGNNIAVYFTYLLPNKLFSIMGTYSMYVLCSSDHTFTFSLPVLGNNILYNMEVGETYIFQAKLFNNKNKVFKLDFKCESIQGNPLDFVIFQNEPKDGNNKVEVKITNSEKFYCFVEFDYFRRRYIPHLFISSIQNYMHEIMPRITGTSGKAFNQILFKGLSFDRFEYPVYELLCENSLREKVKQGINDEIQSCHFGTGPIPLEAFVWVRVQNGPVLFHTIIYIAETSNVNDHTMIGAHSSTEDFETIDSVPEGMSHKRKTTPYSPASKLHPTVTTHFLVILHCCFVIRGVFSF